jgi:hypothetical protein
VKRRNEPVATDTIFSDTPAVDSGVTCAQLFVGRESLVADVYGLKTEKAFVNTLEENICKRGAMDKLISDCAKAEMSERVKQMCVYYSIIFPVLLLDGRPLCKLSLVKHPISPSSFTFPFMNRSTTFIF